MTHWQMYWLTRLDSIEIMRVTGLALSSVAVFILGFLWMISFSDSNEDDCKMCKRFIKIPIVIFMMCTLMLFCVPTTKQMAAIIIIPPITQNEQVKELPANLLELCNEWAKDQVKELKGEVK